MGNDWIPVAERLPATACRVLVTWAKGNGLGQFRVDAASFFPCDQFDRLNHFVVGGGFNQANKFSHWMPMPDAPADGTP